MARTTQPRPKVRRRDLRRRFVGAPERVADGVWLLRGGFARTMNVYLIEDPDTGGVIAYDAGERTMAAAILLAARDLGGLRRVVLGHGDTDHRGSAPALRAAGRGSITVEAHADAKPYAEGAGGHEYWRPELLPFGIRLLHAFLDRAFWDGGPVTVDRTLAEGDQVAGFRVVELAGHAPGLIGLWRARDGLALVSDALYVTDMMGNPQPPALPVDAYNFDRAAAAASLRKLADLEPRIVAPGHLGPLTAPDTAQTLRRVADAG